MNFCMTSNFQKVIISVLSGLKMQQEELTNLRDLFEQLDKDKNGSLVKEELAVGLKNVQCLELFEDKLSGEDSS